MCFHCSEVNKFNLSGTDCVMVLCFFSFNLGEGGNKIETIMPESVKTDKLSCSSYTCVRHITLSLNNQSRIQQWSCSSQIVCQDTSLGRNPSFGRHIVAPQNFLVFYWLLQGILGCYLAATLLFGQWWMHPTMVNREHILLLSNAYLYIVSVLYIVVGVDFLYGRRSSTNRYRPNLPQRHFIWFLVVPNINHIIIII